MNIESLCKTFESRGHRIIRASEGFGVEFDDGNDTWWVLPGDPFSTYAVETVEEIVESEALAQFDRLNIRRRNAIHVLRHYLARQRVAATRHRDGRWWIMTEDGSSTEIAVGCGLTAIVEACDDCFEHLKALLPHRMPRHPSRKLVERLLTEINEPCDHPWPEEAPTIEIPSKLMNVLMMMGVCRAMRALERKDEEFPSESLIADAMKPRGKVGNALLRLAEALPESEASIEMTTGEIMIDFADGHDCYRLNPKSRELREAVHQLGIEAAADRILAEFRSMESSRARVIDALLHVMSSRGYSLDDKASPWQFGRRHREIECEVGETLTASICKHGIAEAARNIAPGDIGEAIAARLAEDTGEARASIHITALTPPPPPTMVLATPDEREADALDSRCRTIVVAALEEREFIYSLTARPNEALETWLSQEQWLAAANRMDEWGDWSTAACMRLDAGQPIAESRIHAYLPECELHEETGRTIIQLAWTLRRLDPVLARKRFGTEGEFVSERARRGDPIACHQLARRLAEPGELNFRSFLSLGREAAHRYLSPSVMSRYHDEAIRWADTTWQWQYPDSESVALAAMMGWVDVARTLEANPYVLPGLFQIGQPGILHASNLIMALASLNPSPWLTAMIARALRMDYESAYTSEAQTLVGGFAGIDIDHLVESWTKPLIRALAIGWLQCRRLRL